MPCYARAAVSVGALPARPKTVDSTVNADAGDENRMTPEPVIERAIDQYQRAQGDQIGNGEPLLQGGLWPAGREGRAR